MKKTIIAIVCIFFFSRLVLIPFANADWPMFRSDLSHSGVGTGSSVLTPTPLWNYTATDTATRTFASDWSSPAIVDGVVYIGESGYISHSAGHYVDLRTIWGGVYALNASSGVKLWNYSINSDVSSSPAVVDGIVYFGSGDNFFALNAINGAQLWNFSCFKVLSSPAVVDGVVYFGAYDNNNVYALNATNGAQLWSYSTDGMVLSSPAVVGSILYIGSDGSKSGNGWGTFYALNATNGNKLWNHTTSSWINSSPAVANGVVYMGFDNDNFYAMNVTDGAKLWNYTTGSGYSSPVVVGGVVYFSSGDSLYALKATNGEKLWNYTTGGGSSPVIVDGVIYFSSGDRVYALGEPYSTTPPRISVLSPQSQTYNDSIVSLVFTLDKPVNWTGYSLDGEQNVTIAGNTTITGLSTGLHNITVYAKDLFDNVGASETVVFKAEPFPTLPVAVASVAAIVVAGAGLLVYFKKRRHVDVKQVK